MSELTDFLMLFQAVLLMPGPTSGQCLCAKCRPFFTLEGNFVNVAYNKTVHASTEWSTKTNPACKLTDGWRFYDSEHRCAHTALNDFEPWMEIDLGSVYTVKHFQFYRRNHGERVGLDILTVKSLSVLVDQQLCRKTQGFKETEQAAVAANKAVVRSNNLLTVADCLQPRTGRYVRLERYEMSKSTSNHFIIMCEAVIKVCTPGLYFGTDNCNRCPNAGNCKYYCQHYYGCNELVTWNLGFKKLTAYQSSILGDESDPVNALDGDPTACTYTDPAQDGTNPRWWQVDLEERFYIDSITIFNRHDCCGNDLQLVHMYVEDVRMSSTFQPTNLFHSFVRSPGSKLRNGASFTFTNGTNNHYGQYVILLTPTPHKLEICEVVIKGSNFTAIQAGQPCDADNELHACEKGTQCINGLCGITVGNPCVGTLITACGPGLICTVGVCKLRTGSTCSSHPMLCQRGTACDSQTNTCRLVIGAKCGSPNLCQSDALCDATFICKLSVGRACNSTKQCMVGAACQTSSSGAKACKCTTNSSQCDPRTGFPGGNCTNHQCIPDYATCNTTSGKCHCDPGYSIFAADLSCKVALRGTCASTADCNSNLVCEHNTCRAATGGECTENNDCLTTDRCDSGGSCRVKPGSDCTGKEDMCVAGSICDSGVCLVRAGGLCDVTNDFCLPGSFCTDNSFLRDNSTRCRLNVSKPCLGSNSNLCEPDSICDGDLCKRRVQKDCELGQCATDTVCDAGKCKYTPGRTCDHADDCRSGLVCDASRICRIKKGESCKGFARLCMSGATCKRRQGGADSVCECTDSPYVQQNTENCEPKPLAAGTPCSSSTNQQCSLPKSICIKDKCQCANGTAMDLVNYSCGLRSGAGCLEDSDPCLTGSVCAVNGKCLLTVGSPCPGRLRGLCDVGLVCDNEICKLNLNGDCSGAGHFCKRGTVCDAVGQCKIPVSSSCGLDHVCVAGAVCNGTCICIDDATESDRKCEAKAGVVSGPCGAGDSCQDQKARCGQSGQCQCDEGYAVDTTRLKCMTAVGGSCQGKEEDCIHGSKCDETTNVCRLEFGQACTETEQCATGDVCDRTCKVDFKGDCAGLRRAYCKHGTFCDWLDKCSLGVGSPCNESEDCAAGATCSESRCACSREVSSIFGIICEPESGRYGSACDDTSPCNELLGTKCVEGVCQCIIDGPAKPDFSCSQNTGQSWRPNDNRIVIALASVFGVVAASLPCVVAFFYNRREKKEADDEMRKRMASAHSLNLLSQQVDLLGVQKGGKDDPANPDNATKTVSDSSGKKDLEEPKDSNKGNPPSKGSSSSDDSASSTN